VALILFLTYNPAGTAIAIAAAGIPIPAPYASSVRYRCLNPALLAVGIAFLTFTISVVTVTGGCMLTSRVLVLGCLMCSAVAEAAIVSTERIERREKCIVDMYGGICSMVYMEGEI